MDRDHFLSGTWSDAELIAQAQARGIALPEAEWPATLCGLRANFALLRERALTLLAAEPTGAPTSDRPNDGARK